MGNSTKFCAAYLANGDQAPLQYPPRMHYDIDMVQGPCLAFASGDYITTTMVEDIGDFVLEWDQVFVDDASLYHIIFGRSDANSYIGWNIGATTLVTPFHVFSTQSPATGHYKLERSGNVATLTTPSETVVAPGIGTDLFTLDQIAKNQFANYFSGSLWNLQLTAHLQTITLPLSEGSGDFVYSRETDENGDPLVIGTINTTDITTMRNGRQDDYHPHVLYGYGQGENLVKYSKDCTNNWVQIRCTCDIAGNLIPSTDNSTHLLYLPASKFALPQNTLGTMHSVVKRGASRYTRLSISTWDTGYTNVQLANVTLDFDNGTIISTGNALQDSGVVNLGDDTYEIWLSAIITNTAEISQYEAVSLLDSTGATTFAGDGVTTSVIFKRNWAYLGAHREDSYIKTEDYIFTGDEFLPFLTDVAPKLFNGGITSYKLPEAQELIKADLLADLAGTGPYLFDASGNAVAFDEDSIATDGVFNNNLQYVYSDCKGLGVYDAQYNAEQESEIVPWFSCV